MTIRWKLLSSIGVSIAALLGILFIISKSVVERDYARLEEQYVMQTMTQAQAAVQDEVTFLATTLADWAFWDDTYTFAVGENKEYVVSNFTDDGFANLRLNLVVVVDNSGKVVYSRSFDMHTGKQAPLPKPFMRELQNYPSLFKHPSGNSKVSGIIKSTTPPLLVASFPILKSDKSGPLHGAIIMGQYLDDLEIKRISEKLKRPINLTPFGSSLSAVDHRHVSGQFSPDKPMLIKPIDSHSVAGYLLLKDINNHPGVIAQIIMPRDIHQRGMASIRLLITALLLAGLFFGCIVVAQIERQVLARLGKLCGGLRMIQETSDLSARLTVDGQDELAHVASAANEMLTALEETQQQVHEREARYRAVVEDQTELICRYQLDGAVTFVNDACCRYLGKSYEELIGFRFAPLIHPEDRERVVQGMASLTPEHPVITLEHRVVMPDGSIRWHEWTYHLLLDAAGNPSEIQGVGRDITERKLAEDRMNYLAYYDGLTDLANRFMFKEELAQSLALCRRQNSLLAVALLDLDRFKDVNDVLGHDVGDCLLQATADRLKSCIRKGDTVARVGGDEFLFLFNGIESRHHAEEMAKRLLNSFAQPFCFDEHELYISASIGICFAPADGDSIDTLVKNADVAMYRAKAAGRNAYQFFTAEMADAVSRHREMEDQLRKAMAQNEFRLFYQPIFDLQTMSLMGVEALLRWQHPEEGLIMPGKFIPIAEENGLIFDLDAWVLKTACRQGMEWLRAGLPPLRIAVNLSARHFQRPGLHDLVTRVLEETAFTPDSLELEITEGAALYNVTETAKVLHQLVTERVHIVIDDFGTGYSSLNYIREFPVDVVKIDRAFIRDLPQNRTNSAIVQATIELAHALGRKITAEGVETAEQLEFLLDCDCDQGQGYYLGKPVPAEEVTRLLLTHTGMAEKDRHYMYAMSSGRRALDLSVQEAAN